MPGENVVRPVLRNRRTFPADFLQRDASVFADCELCLSQEPLRAVGSQLPLDETSSFLVGEHEFRSYQTEKSQISSA